MSREDEIVKYEKIVKKYKKTTSRSDLNNLNKIYNRIPASREDDDIPLFNFPITSRAAAQSQSFVVIERDQDNPPGGENGLPVVITNFSGEDEQCWRNFERVSPSTTITHLLQTGDQFATCQDCEDHIAPPPPPEPDIYGVFLTNGDPFELGSFRESKQPGSIIGSEFQIYGTNDGGTSRFPIEVDDVELSTTGPPSANNPNLDTYNCFEVITGSIANSYKMRLKAGYGQAYVANIYGGYGGDYSITMTVRKGDQEVDFNFTIEILQQDQPEIITFTNNKNNQNPVTTTQAIFPWQSTGTFMSSATGYLNYNPSIVPNDPVPITINSGARMNVWGSTAWDVARDLNYAYVAQISRSTNNNYQSVSNWDGKWRNNGSSSAAKLNSRVDGLSYSITSLTVRTCLVDISPQTSNPYGFLTQFYCHEIGNHDDKDNFEDYKPVKTDFEIIGATDTKTTTTEMEDWDEEVGGAAGIFIRYKRSSRPFGNGKQGSTNGCLSWSVGANYGNNGHRRAGVLLQFRIKITDATKYNSGQTFLGTATGGSETSNHTTTVLVFKGDNETD